jgi:hypothetical protein
MNIKTTVEVFLSQRPHEFGETVQFSWFIFRIASSLGQPLKVESLDFQKIASFTDDFSEPERIHKLQLAALARFQASECSCSLRQSALVSLSYFPGRPDTLMERQTSTDRNDSGWYVGVRAESRSMDDPGSFRRCSLYELTIHDMRMAAYWLLPVGVIINLDEFP